MKEPTVTIVVPVYRRLHFLQEALPSALGQTYTDFELIVSDDGASDEIARYAESLGDPRIRYRRNQKRLGIAMNNYAAFSEARGKYIGSLHDDDLWEPGFLGALVPPLEADPMISVAFSDHYLIDGEGKRLDALTRLNSHRFRRDRLEAGRHQPFLNGGAVLQTIPIAMAAVFRRSILQGAEYPTRIGGSFDHWLAYLAVKDGQACYYVPQRLTSYRIHRDSGTAGHGLGNLRDAIYARRKMLRDPRLAPYRRRLHNDLGVFYGKMALYFLARRSYRRGGVFLRQAYSLMNRPKTMLGLAFNTVKSLCKKSPA